MKNNQFITILIFLFTCISASNAQYKVLYNFNDTTGANPITTLVLSKGLLYGTTGIYQEQGNIFSIKTDGTGIQNIHTFGGGTAGYGPQTLTLSATADTIFGTTVEGGTSKAGNVYSIRTNGTGYHQILNFTGANGLSPGGALTLLGNTLYGITSYGGPKGKGTIFSVHTDGTGYRDMLDFNDTNGVPTESSLILSVTSDTLFGMALGGGANNHGCIFCIDTNGTGYKDLFDFSLSNSHGGDPFGNLLLSGHKFYGMTHGQDSLYGCVFSINTDGTGYKDLLNFVLSNGGAPFGSLVLSKGILYGMTTMGETANHGDLFAIDTDGTGYQNLYAFNAPDSGYSIGCTLTLSVTGDTLFGSASGGVKTYGLIFMYSLLNPTGLNEVKVNKGEITLFPNPNNGAFTLQQQEADSKEQEIKIYNELGQEIYTQTFNQPHKSNEGLSLNLGNQPSGLYFYKVTDNNNNIVGVGKFIIEK